MSQEAVFSCRTRGNSSPKDKPRVYFTCHQNDFERFFDKIRKDIFKTHDCAIYYTKDMSADLSDENTLADLSRMNLFVIPVTLALLTQPNRALDFDLRFAEENDIPILPLMMEPGLDVYYGKPDKFGERQYIDPYCHDMTAVSYEEKLKRFLDSVLIDGELADRVRKAFDAYIFLSYRKKDRAYANKLMRMIHGNPECRDVAVWFDEFLTAGESFIEGIEKILYKSDLFALLVTPNLLEKPDGKPNFVMGEEYPAARDAGKKILPAEMERTDLTELKEGYPDIPDPVDTDDGPYFRQRLLASLNRATAENNKDPEHEYLIGLAYLNGIDVETDTKRAYVLIKSAADADHVPAVKKLVQMYQTGDGVAQSLECAEYWQNRLVSIFADRAEKNDTEEDAVILLREGIKLGDIAYAADDLDSAEDVFSASYDLGKRLSFGAISKTLPGKIKILFKKYVLNKSYFEESILYMIKACRMLLEISYARGKENDISSVKKAMLLLRAVNRQFETAETATELVSLSCRMSEECLESGNTVGASEWLDLGFGCIDETCGQTRELRFALSRLYGAYSDCYSMQSDHASAYRSQQTRLDVLNGLREEDPDDYNIRYEVIKCLLSEANICINGKDLKCAEALAVNAEELIGREPGGESHYVKVLRSQLFMICGMIAYERKEYDAAADVLRQSCAILVPVSETKQNAQYIRQLTKTYELIGDAYHSLGRLVEASAWHKKAEETLSGLLTASSLVRDVRTSAGLYEKLLDDFTALGNAIAANEYYEKSLWTRRALSEGLVLGKRAISEDAKKRAVNDAFHEENMNALRVLESRRDEIRTMLESRPKNVIRLIDTLHPVSFDLPKLMTEASDLAVDFLKTHVVSSIRDDLAGLTEFLRKAGFDQNGAFSGPGAVLAAKQAKSVYGYILKHYTPFAKFDEDAMLLLAFCGRLYLALAANTPKKDYEEFERVCSGIVFLHYPINDVMRIETWQRIYSWIKE